MTDYAIMSIDHLTEYRDQWPQQQSEWNRANLVLQKRLAVKHALLDLAKQLDAEGMVVVPMEPTTRMLHAADGYTDLIQPFSVKESAGEEGSKEAREWRHNEFKCAWWAMINNAPLLAAAPLPEGV